MLDSQAIEAINFEQLVTATDRLLLGSHRLQRRVAARGSSPSLAVASLPTGQLAARPGAPPAWVGPATAPVFEQTLIVRGMRKPAAGSRATVIVCAFVLPMVAAMLATIAIASL